MTDSILDELVEECRDLLEGIERVLERFEKGESADDDATLLKRNFHSIKGAATFAGADDVAALAHKVEDLLGEFDHPSRARPVIPAIWDSHDAIYQALERVAGGPGAIPTRPPEPSSQSVATDSASTTSGTPRPGREPAPLADQPEGTEPESNSLRVGLQKLDQLVNLASELVLVRNQVNTVLRDPEVRHAESESLRRAISSLEQLNLITNDLQRAVMETRLVRIHELVKDLPRQTRRLSKKLGKQIHCEIVGDKIEVDKSVLDRLKRPLGHLVRNACDHGIEPPARRLALGKPATGTVRFVTIQDENFVRILLEDDGGGIDDQVIRRVAHERGLITPTEVDRLSRERALTLIFESGFSSRDDVTSTSGRGIGLDVVRNEIEDMNGSVSLRTEIGQGTTFEIRLPVSLFVVQVLNFQVGANRYALPSTNIVEVIRMDQEGVRRIEHVNQIAYREQVHAIIDLAHLFRLECTAPANDKNYCIICSHLGRRAAIPIDGIFNQEELVVRNLQGRLNELPGVRGLSTLGDGSVVPVLDIAHLLDHAEVE